MERYRKIETMNAAQAKEWLSGRKEGEYTLLDVRQPAEYRAGHLPGAVFIPLPELPDRIGELSRSKPVLTYCRSGNRSRSAAALLLTEGFDRVASMEGGITAWNGQTAAGDYREGLYLLEDRETPEELISLAWSLEEGSLMFYEKAEEIASDGAARELLLRLAGAEERHKSNIYDAYRMTVGEDAPDFRADQTLRGIMEGGVQVEEALNFLKGEDRTVRDLIEVSMEMETNALDLYIKMLRQIERSDVREIFALLIKEEKHHLSMLGKLLDERVAQSE